MFTSFDPTPIGVKFQFGDDGDDWIGVQDDGYSDDDGC